jgi:hypothetical protein
MTRTIKVMPIQVAEGPYMSYIQPILSLGLANFLVVDFYTFRAS